MYLIVQPYIKYKHQKKSSFTNYDILSYALAYDIGNARRSLNTFVIDYREFTFIINNDVHKIHTLGTASGHVLFESHFTKIMSGQIISDSIGYDLKKCIEFDYHYRERYPLIYPPFYSGNERGQLDKSTNHVYLDATNMVSPVAFSRSKKLLKEWFEKGQV